MMENTTQATVSPPQGMGDSVTELRGGSKIMMKVSVQNAVKHVDIVY
jgi:hypothetical protein